MNEGARRPISSSVAGRCGRRDVRTALVFAAWFVGASTIMGCGTVTRIHAPTALAARNRWVVLPFTNLAETVQAGERTEAMLDTVLRDRGIGSLDRYPAPKDDELHFSLSDRARFDGALAWAKGQHYDYGVTGTVEEWRYKSGNEAEPAVGMTLTVIDLSNNKVVWSGSGSREGSSFQNASGVALTLIGTLVEGMPLK